MFLIAAWIIGQRRQPKCVDDTELVEASALEERNNAAQFGHVSHMESPYEIQ